MVGFGQTGCRQKACRLREIKLTNVWNVEIQDMFRR